MIILLISVASAIALGVVYYLTYKDPVESVVFAFLIFVAIEGFLRSVLNKKFPFDVRKGLGIEPDWGNEKPEKEKKKKYKKKK